MTYPQEPEQDVQEHHNNGGGRGYGRPRPEAVDDGYEPESRSGRGRGSRGGYHGEGGPPARGGHRGEGGPPSRGGYHGEGGPPARGGYHGDGGPPAGYARGYHGDDQDQGPRFRPRERDVSPSYRPRNAGFRPRDDGPGYRHRDAPVGYRPRDGPRDDYYPEPAYRKRSFEDGPRREVVPGTLKGVVKWFNGQKGFGFITPADGSTEIFVHHSAIQVMGFRSLNEGDEVSFNTNTGRDGRTKASDVTILAPAGPIDDVGAKRARRPRAEGYERNERYEQNDY